MSGLHKWVVLLFDVFFEVMTHAIFRLINDNITFIHHYNISMAESITNNRIVRLSSSHCLLGEPDIISIRQTKFATNFFGKEKKIQDLQQNYINGLVFPSTAHFSSFISTRYKAKDHSKLIIKAKLLIFDAYGEKDIQIQINIPGSLQIKTFNLRGQQVPYQKQDYDRAYFSSFLRSLYPMNYPSIILYPLLNRIQLLKSIIKNFIPFSYKNQLRQLNYQLEIYHNQSTREWTDTQHNISIEIVIDYCIDNHFTNLLKIILQELKKANISKYHETELKFKLMEAKYGEIICKTAEKLLLHGQANRLKQYQIQALFPIKKYAEVAYIGKSLIESGGTNEHISKLILISLIEIGQDVRFLKSLNLVNNLYNFNEKKVRQISHQHNNKNILNLQTYVNKNRSISQYPQFCFQFDNSFLNRLSEYQNLKQLLQRHSKQGFTIAMLNNLQSTLNQNPLFYDVLIRYQKTKGWKTLMKYRTDAFWLQVDFLGHEETIKNNNKDFDDNLSFFQESFDKKQEMQLQEQQFQREEQEEKTNSNREKVQEKAQEHNIVNQDQESFDGNLSQHEEQTQQFYLPKCSAKVNTSQKPNLERKTESKILCGVNLQKLFMQLYNDIKMQNNLDIWQNKLRQFQISYFSLQKKQLTAMIYLKKGFLHKKLQRNKKCEQSLKMARRLSSSYVINLVAIYQLLLLYIDNKNTKGVQFYLFELLKLFKSLGIQNYDIVPEWAKPIIQYVLSNQGLTIIKNVHPLFKSVFGLFLRANYTEQEVESFIQLRK